MKEPKTLTDGYVNTLGGVNSALLPRQIGPNQLAWAENVVNRGGFPQTRPAFRYIGKLKTGLFQGACYYTLGGIEYISTMFDGYVYLHRLKGQEIETVNITPENDRNHSTMTKAWGVQAENWLVWQNGWDRPFLYNGGPTARRAGQEEVSTGTWMVYGNGRLFVAQDDLLYAGNIVSNSGPIQFTETNYFLGGAPYGFGSKITGMAILPSMSTETGQGELVVCTKEVTYTFQSQVFDRTQWPSNAMQRILFPSIGMNAGGTLTQVNQDLYGRWTDGWRSVRRGLMDARSEGFIPLSEEIRRVTDKETESLTSYASAIYFKNRLLMTCQPYIKNGMVVFRSIAALDFTPLSLGLGAEIGASYDGIWTGMRFVKLIKGSLGGRERAFIIGQFNTNDYYLFEIVDGQAYDGNEENENRIQSHIESRSFMFDNNGFTLKRLNQAEFYFSKLRGETDVTIQYRPEDHCEWYDWADFSLKAKSEYCPESCESSIPTYKPQYRRKIRIGQPDQGQRNDNVEGASVRMIDGQIKVKWTGHMGINRLQLEAVADNSDVQAKCPNETEERDVRCQCDNDEYTISITTE